VNAYTWSVDRPYGTIAALVCVCCFGGVSMFLVRAEHVPQPEIPAIEIVTFHPELPGAEMETLVTRPIEDAVAAVAGIREIQSISRAGVSRITVLFGWDEPMMRRMIELRERIDDLYPSLPSGSSRPSAFSRDPGREAVSTVAVVPENRELFNTVQDIAAREIAPRFRQIPGTGEMEMRGITEPVIEAHLHPDILLERGLTPDTVGKRIEETVIHRPAGTVRTARKEYPLIFDSKLDSLTDIRNLPIPVQGGGTVRLEDLGEVRDGRTPPRSFFVLDGHPAVGIDIYPGNLIRPGETVRDISLTAKTITREYGEILSVFLVSDNSQELDRSLQGLIFAVVAGTVAAFVVLLRKYRNLTVCLVVAAVVPSSILATMIGLYLMDKTVNPVSLGGLALGVGLVLDNTLVMADRVGKLLVPDRVGIGDAVRHTAGTVWGATATTIIVFLPVVAVPGVLRGVFSDLVFVVVVMTAYSYVYAVYVFPALYVKAGPAPIPQKHQPTQSCSQIEGILISTLQKRRIVLSGVALGVILLGISVISHPKSLYPPVRTPVLEIVTRFPAEYSIERVVDTVQERDLAVLSHPAVHQAVTWGGADPGSVRRKGDPKYDYTVATTRLLLSDPPDKLGTAFTSDLERIIQPFPGEPRMRRDLPAIHRVLGMEENTAADLTVTATDRSALSRLERTVIENTNGRCRSRLTNLPGSGWIIDPDHDRMQSLRLTPARIGTSVRYHTEGKTVAFLRSGNAVTPVTVFLSLSRTDKVGDTGVARIPILLENGLTHLGMLAGIQPDKAPSLLERFNRQPVVRFTTAVPGTPVEECIDAVREAGVPGIRFMETEHGIQQELRRSGFVLLGAAGLIYLILVMEFEAWILPARLLFCAAAGLAPAVFSMRVAGIPVNAASILGLVILCGTIMNTVILVTRAVLDPGNTGMHRDRCFRPGSKDPASPDAVGGEHVVRAILERIPTVQITISTTVIALVPVLLISGHNDPYLVHTTVPVVTGLVLGTPVSVLSLLSVLSGLTSAAPDLHTNVYGAGS
jgi:hydrophobic/amphiphilic exporter-1 (mainly G- bacteria), HAE1 family